MTKADQRAVAADTGLTDNEGSLLALVIRRQPVTAYQLLRIYEQSPVSSFNESKGSLYPLIRRMKLRGYLAGRPVAGDGRGAERLSCTEAGREAARRWLRQIRPSHILPDDPLRARLLSFTLLDATERQSWIAEARAMTVAKIAEVEAYLIGLDMPFRDAVASNALGFLEARLTWLDRLAAEDGSD